MKWKGEVKWLTRTSKFTFPRDVFFNVMGYFPIFETYPNTVNLKFIIKTYTTSGINKMTHLRPVKFYFIS